MTGALNRLQIAWRAARDIPDGAVVNLGIGIPLGIPHFIPDDREIVLHSENGLLGMGPPPPEGEEDWELINASTRPTTLVPGGTATLKGGTYPAERFAEVGCHL